MIRTLLPYARIVTSQLGEDGMIAELLRRLELDSKPEFRWAVDVGAGDGVTYSNTHHLRMRGWNSVNVERDRERFNKLHHHCCEKGLGPASCFHKEVTAEPNSLDSILNLVSGLPGTYDLLNVDIDGPDYWVWKHHIRHRPAVVVIEVHGGIPPGIMKVHSDGDPYSSWTAMLGLAREKMYTLVASMGNMIFVGDERVDEVGLSTEELENPDGMWVPPHVRGLLTPLLLARRDFDCQFDEAMRRFARCPTHEECREMP